jgi:biopolymer transport protein ExbD
MGKVKIKKKDVFIDMTPMSDVMVLLLTFFMLTSTFVKKEPVKVFTPSSVSEIKVPEKDILSILVDKTGKVFMSLDNRNDMDMVFGDMTEQYGLTLNTQQRANFVSASIFGSPMKAMGQWLSLPNDQRDVALADLGIPTDSVNGQHSEFQNWIIFAHRENPKLKIAIKADAETPYRTIKKVMNSLQDIRENRYYLITNLKKLEEDK